MATKPKTKTKQQAAAPAPKTAVEREKELVAGEIKKFEKEVTIAGDWCTEHKVPITLVPTEVLLLAKQRDVIRAAVLAAGGADAVPMPVLLYEQTLDDAVHFLMDHGVGRMIQHLRERLGR